MTFARTFRKGDRVRLVDDPAALGFFVRYGIDGSSATVEWSDCNRPASVEQARLRHAPVEVVGKKPVPPRTTCPECGGALSVDHEAEKSTPTPDGRIARTVVRVVFCGFCDYIEEVPK